VESPSKDDYLNWKEDPVTKFVFALLHDERKQECENLCSGLTLAGNSATAEATARVVGRIEGLDTLLKIQYDDIGD